MKKKIFSPKVTVAGKDRQQQPSYSVKESILPSVGALTGAARMVARSAARSFTDDIVLPRLNAVGEEEWKP